MKARITIAVMDGEHTVSTVTQEYDEGMAKGLELAGHALGDPEGFDPIGLGYEDEDDEHGVREALGDAITQAATTLQREEG